MSALARFFKGQGFAVAGYDRVSSPLTEALESEDIQIHYSDDIRLIPDVFTAIHRRQETLVVYTPAIPSKHGEKRFFSANGFRLMKRSELLGLISEKGRNIAVAGTHGKTSISTMIAHILKFSDMDAAAFLGGISNNYHTNYISGKGEWIVLEADEFDRSFLWLSPDIAVISAMDADHLDIYGTEEELVSAFHEFASRVKEGGILLVKNDLKIDRKVNHKIKWLTYGMEKKADYFTGKMKENGGFYSFDIHTPDSVIEDLRLGIPGKINVQNAVVAVAVAELVGVDEHTIRKALLLFKGVKRRFDIRVLGEKYVYIDDYAHHPCEISTTLESVRSMFPGKKITTVFQPHLYSRTRDFAEDFAQSLDQFDRLIILDIYPAREDPVPGVSSGIILEKMTLKQKYWLKKEELMAFIEKDPPEVLLTMGAGDIDCFVKPLEKVYHRLNNE
ncbi:MAG: UDP-N-acetylmuramate--L-alanine ligase [Chlorobi bacterium]|nr:UDP-N-acetylmuramate--L-alanine ligase [Chlorobiota bacterium]